MGRQCSSLGATGSVRPLAYRNDVAYRNDQLGDRLRRVESIDARTNGPTPIPAAVVGGGGAAVLPSCPYYPVKPERGVMQPLRKAGSALFLFAGQLFGDFRHDLWAQLGHQAVY